MFIIAVRTEGSVITVVVLAECEAIEAAGSVCFIKTSLAESYIKFGRNNTNAGM